MRILVVCHRFPFPPARGGKIRPFNVIKHLSARHQVTVASLARTEDEAAQGRGIAEHCNDYLMETISPVQAWTSAWTRLPTSTPSSMGYFHSAPLARRISEELARHRYDLIFAHCSSIAHYVENVPDTPKIMDFGDMDSQKWLTYADVRSFPRSLGYRIEGRKLEKAEARIARKFDLCTCTTKAELADLRRLDHATPTDWFPNGVDLQFFAPTDQEYDRHTICFVGRMDYFPNQEAVRWFCRDILPRLQSAVPSLKFLVVGANPSREILRLGDLPGVMVTGTVPDVRDYVRGACLTVAPLNIARGTQNKILESLAMGVPVVTTQTAAGGVDAVPGEHLIAASNAGDFGDAVLRLVESDDERRRFALAGRRRVETNHSWDASMKRLDVLIEAVLLAQESRGRQSAAHESVHRSQSA